MFFTRFGIVVAWIALVAGALRMATGLYAVFNLDFDPSRYLGGATPGHAIDQGGVSMLIGLTLGILTEISRSVRRKD